MNTQMSLWIFIPLLLVTFGFAAEANAADVPQAFTLDGQLFADTASTMPLLDASVPVKIQILDEAMTCVVYEESQTVNTIFTKGYFSIQIGSATTDVKRSGLDSGNAMNLVFQNTNNITGRKILDSTACTVTAAGGQRRFVRVTISPATLGGAPRVLSPDIALDSVPSAVVAERAESLQGLRAADVLKVNSDAGSALTQANLESLFTSTTRFSALSSVIDGTSPNYLRTTSGGAAVIPTYTTASPPASAAVGSFWFDSTDGKMKYKTSGGTEVLSTSTAATGTAGGDLSGTYPNPTVAKIRGVTVSATAPTTGQILKMGATDWAPSNFSIGDLKTTAGTQQFAGSTACTAAQTLTWSSLTDTFTCTNIAGLAASVVTSGTIDAARMPAAALTWTVSGADVSRSTGQVGIGTALPGSTLDVKGTMRLSGATSGYVGFAPAAAAGSTTYTLPAADGVTGTALTTNGSGVLSWASPVPTSALFVYQVRVATLAETALSGTQTVDGIALAVGDRVLVKNQTDESENGVYVVASGAWTRAPDMATWAKTIGYYAIVSEGATWAGVKFSSMTTTGGTLGTTAVNWNSDGSQTAKEMTAFGSYALQAITTATRNTAFGSYAAYKTTTGNSNTAIGADTLYANVTGEKNTALGSGALSMSVDKNGSTAIGYMAMAFQLPGATGAATSYNTAVGTQALLGNAIYTNNTGTRNTAIGYNALSGMTSGSNNLGVGWNSGTSMTTGSYNVIIGSSTGSTIATSSNNILIADGAGNERIKVVSTGNVGIATTNPVHKLDVTGNIHASGQILTGSFAVATNAIDWDTGNSGTTSYDCAAPIALSNLRDGGTYTLVVTGTGTTMCDFSTSVPITGQGTPDTVTYRFRPANAARYGSSHTLYTFTRVGTVIYASWSSGF